MGITRHDAAAQGSTGHGRCDDPLPVLLRDERQNIAGPRRCAEQIERLSHRQVVHHLRYAGERTDHLIGLGAPLRESFQHPDDPTGFGRRQRQVDALTQGFNHVLAAKWLFHHSPPKGPIG
jgi:hypothetical protein